MSNWGETLEPKSGKNPDPVKLEQKAARSQTDAGQAATRYIPEQPPITA
jgi:hypothetical protein